VVIGAAMFRFLEYSIVEISRIRRANRLAAAGR
jgi:hypothetical protein